MNCDVAIGARKAILDTFAPKLGVPMGMFACGADSLLRTSPRQNPTTVADSSAVRTRAVGDGGRDVREAGRHGQQHVPQQQLPSPTPPRPSDRGRSEPSEKDTKLAQKLDQLQPFIAVLPQECMGQRASFAPT